MKIIVHAGMPKTGSTSIQKTFARADISPVEYMPLGPANHSGKIMLSFKNKVENYHAFQARGKSRVQLLEERKVALEGMDRYFAKTTAETVVISAEGISALTRDETALFAEFLRRQTDDVQVIAYIRPPCSYMNSAFQQQLKSGVVASFDSARFWPKYENRFEKIDTVFGRENVTLKPFIRSELVNSNVVHDFAEFLDVKVNEEDIVLTNESLSLEAIALLYAQRGLGKGQLRGFDRSLQINADFVKFVSQIGDRKMTFSRSLAEDIIKGQSRDVAWIEDRLGREILDLPDADAGGITCAADLLDIAVEQHAVLDELIAQRFDLASGSSHDQTARKLDVLMASFI